MQIYPTPDATLLMHVALQLHALIGVAGVHVAMDCDFYLLMVVVRYPADGSILNTISNSCGQMPTHLSIIRHVVA
jgi:hypothetical protein